MSKVVEEATRLDAVWGRELLQVEPWTHLTNFAAGVGGYAAGLGDRSDWRQVREELMTDTTERFQGELRDDLKAQEVWVRSEIDVILARQWAQSDIDAAVDWYARELVRSPDQPQTPQLLRTVSILQSVPTPERYRVLDWMNEHRFEAEWNDQVVVQYTRALGNRRPDGDVERLVAMPVAEADRAAILEAFATPMTKNGQVLLRHPPEILQSLIEAARLSAPERERWLEVVDGATWNGR